MIDSWIDQMTGEQWIVCVPAELFSIELNQSNLNDGDKTHEHVCELHGYIHHSLAVR